MAISNKSFQLPGSPNFGDVLDYLFDGSLSMNRWQPKVNFGSGNGGIMQSKSGTREFLIRPGLSVNSFYGYFPGCYYGCQSAYSWSHIIYDDTDPILLAEHDGTKGSQIGIITTNCAGTLVGTFQNGETVSISMAAGNPVTATLVHWDYASGLMWLSGMTTLDPALPAVTNYSNRQVTGLTSGATVQTATSTTVCHSGITVTPPTTLWIEKTSGVSPVGLTITGATTGITAAVTSYNDDTGLAAVSSIQGGFDEDEVVNWTGGAGKIHGCWPIIKRFNGWCGSSTDFQKTTGVQASTNIIVGEDEDRFYLLTPISAVEYSVILIGDWLIDAQSGTYAALCGGWEGNTVSAFPQVTPGGHYVSPVMRTRNMLSCCFTGVALGANRGMRIQPIVPVPASMVSPWKPWSYDQGATAPGNLHERDYPSSYTVMTPTYDSLGVFRDMWRAPSASTAPNVRTYPGGLACGVHVGNDAFILRFDGSFTP